MDEKEQMTNLEQMYVMIDAARTSQLNSFAHDLGSEGSRVWAAAAAVKRETAKIYALASIAESLARIASTVGNVSFDLEQPINAVRTSPWQ